MNQTLQPLSPPSADSPAASHPQRGWSFLPREGVFVEGPGSWGQLRWDPPSAVAWWGQPGPSLLAHPAPSPLLQWSPRGQFMQGEVEWSLVHSGTLRNLGAEEGDRGSQSRGTEGQELEARTWGGGSGTGRWTAWGPGVDVLCWGQGP